ncbi:crossover junction endonuclease MUS81-like isoform X2 [Dendronephthya gigantea]|uniref:crossover junction endonuclease MUS81-like isoform X2 n=1 Tax=Dendronephthya gigantea TaxID=151771 RepID=UPI0010697556|nr:crossover junction endonuclease MUS81-like isoform X2 [Dendronephthya gigantea]
MVRAMERRSEGKRFQVAVCLQQGPGIAKRLDEELEKHNQELKNEVVLDVADDDVAEVDFPDMRVPLPTDMVQTSPVSNGTPKTGSTEPKPKKKRKSSPREYIPLYRSGPYAMMMALLKASERIGYKGYLTKAELQQQAQPFTDTSFTVPEPDSYYTAWSSMSTLIKKGFVMKAGNPARFSLTDAGYALCNKLTTATETHNTTIGSPYPTSPQLPTNPISPPSTLRSPQVSKSHAATPRSQATPKPSTPSATITSMDSPSINVVTGNDSPNSEYPYGNPSKDFLASYRYKTSGTEVMPNQVGSLKFWYVGSDGECVDHQDMAGVIIDDEISFGYLIKCQKLELDKSKVKYKLDESRPGKDGYIFAYVDSQSIERLSQVSESTTLAMPKKKPSAITTTMLNEAEDDSDDEILMRPLFERLAGAQSDCEKTNASASSSVEKPEIISITELNRAKSSTTSRPSGSKSNTTGLKPSSAALSVPGQEKPPSQTTQRSTRVVETNLMTTQTKSLNTHEKQPTQAKRPVQITLDTEEKQPLTLDIEPSKTSTHSEPPKEKSISLLATTKGLDPSSESATSNKVEKVIVPEFQLKPGSYEIVLCVDFIETTGGSKTGRKEEMVKELRMNGVYFDVRKLNVGDFLWIAREKILPIPGQLVLPERRELVLDYIVERKRMDDLCSSIKDGRFKEQKFRLLNSGLQHPVYLVEDFGSMNLMSMPAQTLEQAIVNTQIGQEFFVKRTRDIKDSAAYLTLMTRYLQTTYENKTLNAIRREDIEHVKIEENKINTFLMTFQELNDISIKNRILTVGELFGKQLLQIPGVAAEKVVGILEQYPTLKDLLEAYEEQTTEKAKETLLSDIKFGKMKRKIGPSVSKTVYQLYCTKGALS